MCRDKQQWINEVKSVLKGFQTLSLSTSLLHGCQKKNNLKYSVYSIVYS